MLMGEKKMETNEKTMNYENLIFYWRKQKWVARGAMTLKYTTSSDNFLILEQCSMSIIWTSFQNMYLYFYTIYEKYRGALSVILLK